ncbi:MAG TPA: arginase family protein [Thermoanaerobaculia bacterium]|nr:arginase family protein [Thermoanaerobaculia bacterium]
MIALLGAPSNLGLKPYDDGRPRSVSEAPRVYRELGLVERLGARDLGDVPVPPYTDFERPPGGTRHEAAISAFSRSLAEAITDDFLLVLGGDCSILLGSLLGLRKRGRVGLAFVDGHCDFALPSISVTGGAAGMDLALAVGRGGALSRLAETPLLREEDAAVIARKDQEDEPYYGPHSLTRSAVLDLPAEGVETALERLGRPELDGFWIHLDVDVLDPGLMPAVDSPEPGGLSFEGLARLLGPLVRHPKALGMEVTIYDPELDPDRVAGSRLVDLLVEVCQLR